MDISVIIPNYKSKAYLEACIKSLKKNMGGLSFEIVAVNNDQENLDDLEKSGGVRVFNLLSNGGFGAACNAGAISSAGRILFFLNPDTELETANVNCLLEAFDDPSVGIAAPRLVIPGGDVQEWSAGKEITLRETIKNNMGLVESRRLWENSGTCEADWVSGAALAIRRELFEDLGGFDERFFMYFEDVDLCRRTRTLGKKILLLPHVKVLHHGGKSADSAKERKKQYYRSQDYYFKKHFGSPTSVLVKLLRGLSF